MNKYLYCSQCSVRNLVQTERNVTEALVARVLHEALVDGPELVELICRGAHSDSCTRMQCTCIVHVSSSTLLYGKQADVSSTR